MSMKEFKFFQKNTILDVDIIYPEDLVFPHERIAYRDGYMWAQMGNHMIGSPYVHSFDLLYIWNRGWINQQMENQYERV